jgi:hypothetical protein
MGLFSALTGGGSSEQAGGFELFSRNGALWCGRAHVSIKGACSGALRVL